MGDNLNQPAQSTKPPHIVPALSRLVESQPYTFSAGGSKPYSPVRKAKARMGLVSVTIRIVASSTPAAVSFGMKVSIRYV